MKQQMKLSNALHLSPKLAQMRLAMTEDANQNQNPNAREERS